MLSRKKRDLFSVLFDKHYIRLYNYAFKVLKNKEVSEELVQETFIKLWENIAQISLEDRSIASFLIITLKNKIVDNYRKDQVRTKHNNLYYLQQETQIDMNNDWELGQEINTIYNTLPENTLHIFRLSREKDLTYKEIAKLKTISVKTVESHISKALEVFRLGLKDYL
jgi:RNA polymerase sigma-70 factor (ECF subfamily)